MSVLDLLPGDEVVPLAAVPSEFRPTPPSREILHVPKAGPFAG